MLIKTINHDALPGFEANEHYVQSAIVATGILNSGSITSGFGAINIGDSAFTTTGTITAEQLTSTDDITMQGEVLTLGTAKAEIQFKSSTTTGIIAYGLLGNTFNFHDSGITTTDLITTNTLDVNASAEIGTILHVIGVSLLSGGVGIGATPTTAYPLFIDQDQDSQLTIRVDNENTGTSARTRVRLKAQATVGVMEVCSSNFIGTFIDQEVKNTTTISSEAGGLLIGTSGANSMFLGTNDDLALTIDASQNITMEEDLAVTGTINLSTLGCIGTGNYFLGDGDNLTAINSGQNNLAFGTGAGASTVDGLQNVYLGFNAGNTNVSGDNNMFIGASAGFACTGSSNAGVGFNSLGTLVSGGNNVGIGNNALRGAGSTHDFHDNVGIGIQTGFNLDTGHNNVLIGTNAGAALTTGRLNVLIGTQSGRLLTTALWNTCVGYLSGNNCTGNSNTFLGTQSGHNSTSAVSNVYIGFNAGFRQTTADNQLIIDNQDRGTLAAEPLEALIYGQFHDTVGSQLLRVNATLEVGNATTGQVTKLGDGGDTNYTQISATGDITQAGTAIATLLQLQVTNNVGFYGTTPVTQNQLAIGVGASVDDVITELQRLGLVRQAA